MGRSSQGNCVPIDNVLRQRLILLFSKTPISQEYFTDLCAIVQEGLQSTYILISMKIVYF